MADQQERSTGGPSPIARVSVIIPAYNHGRYIVDTIDSAFEQSHPNVEVIVVNDGSPDDTAARLAALVGEGRIRYVEQSNAGQSAARNRGAMLATGKYLAFLDDDDLWPPDSLAWRVAELENNHELDVVYGTWMPFSENPPAAPPETESSPATRLIEWIALFAGNPIVTPGQALVRRSAFEAVGGFSPDVWGADDWDLWFRLLQKRPALHVARRAVYYRVHERNASRHAARLCENVLTVVERYLPFVPAGQRPLARFLAFANLWSYWRVQVSRAMRAAAARHAWSEVARGGRVLARLAVRAVASRQLLKLQLLRGGRWRVDANDPFVRTVHGSNSSREVG